MSLDFAVFFLGAVLLSFWQPLLQIDNLREIGWLLRSGWGRLFFFFAGTLASTLFFGVVLDMQGRSRERRRILVPLLLGYHFGILVGALLSLRISDNSASLYGWFGAIGFASIGIGAALAKPSTS